MNLEHVSWNASAINGALLGGLIFVTAYVLLSLLAMPSTAHEEEANVAAPEGTELRDFTHLQLGQCGHGDKLYTSIKNDVFDVSSNNITYGQGGAYSIFAGNDCSVCLAKMSFETRYLNLPVAGLSHGELETLDEWYHTFKHVKRYPIVGKLSIPPSYDSLTREELRQMQAAAMAEPPPHRVHPPLLVGVDGAVYDVGYGGVDLYGLSGPYHRFCGRDATRALAKMSFDEKDLDHPALDDLDDTNKKTLRDWAALFERKYPKVANLATD